MPAAAELGVEVAGEGVCRLAISERHLNEAGVAHGGVLFTLADTALGRRRPRWVGTQFPLQLLRAVRVGDVIGRGDRGAPLAAAAQLRRAPRARRRAGRDAERPAAAV